MNRNNIDRAVFVVCAIAVAVVSVLLFLVATGPRADAAPYSGATPTFQTTRGIGQVKTAPVRLVSWQPLPMGRIAVEFSNGSTFNVRACRYEDGHRCYWDATFRGNGLGIPFVQIKGARWYIAL